MRKFKWLLLILLFAAPAFAQNVRVDNVTFSSVQGFPFLPGATITICTAGGTGLPCTPTVAGTCLSISDAVCNQSSTITSDAFGNYGFWIQPGSYTYTVTKAGFGGFGPRALTLSCQPASTCTTTGPQTFTGQLNCKNLQNVSCIDDSNQQGWAGSDFGGWFNSAYAAGFGGTTPIYAFSNTGNRVNFSTAMSATSTGKTLNLNCLHPTNGQGTGGFSLNFTPVTTVTMLTLDYTPTSSVTWTPSEIKGCTFVNNQNFTQGGAGSSATGIKLGTTNGGAGWLNYTNDAVIGFGTGLLLDNSVGGWGQALNNTTIGDNTTGISLTAAQEVLHLAQARIMSNGTGVKSTTSANIVAVQTQCDSNTVLCFDLSSATSGGLYEYGSHHEDFNTTNCNYVSDAVNAEIFGGDAIDDNTSGTCNWMFNFTGNAAYGIYGLHTGGATGRTFTNIVQVNNPAIGNFFINNQTPSVVTADSQVLGGSSLSYNATICTVGAACHSYFTNNSAGAAKIMCIGRCTTATGLTGMVNMIFNSGLEHGYTINNTVSNQTWAYGTGEGGCAGSGAASTGFGFFDFTALRFCVDTNGLITPGSGYRAVTLVNSNTLPTIAAAGCGGSAASIVVANGTAAFKVNVGTAPTSACTLTFPAATTGWNVHCDDITTQSTSVFVQKQTGAESTTSVTITNFSDVAVATAFATSDILKCTASAD